MTNPLVIAELGLAGATLLPFAYYYSKIKLNKVTKPERPDSKLSVNLQILLPMWNEESVIKSKLENLAEEVRAVKASNDHQISLLIVDSASTDSSVEICNNWLEDNSNIFDDFSLIEMPKRLGKTAAVVLALEKIHQSKSIPDLVFMTDADAILESGCLESLLSWFSDDQYGAVGATPIRRNALESEKVHRDMFSMLREYESNVGSTSMLEGSGLLWRSNLISPSELFPDSNADDAQIASIVLSKGKRVIQDPDAKFTDFAPTNSSEQFRQKKRRGQGLIVNFLRSRKAILSNKNKISRTTTSNFKMNYYFHVIAPLTSLGFVITGVARYVRLLYQGNSPLSTANGLELSVIGIELALLSSIILAKLNLRLPFFSQLSGLASGMQALLSAWFRILSGKKSNLWDQHIETRIERD